MTEPEKWPPHCTRRLTDYEARDGDQEVEFVACFDAKPHATVRWLFNGAEIKPGANFRFAEEPQGQYCFWIAKVGCATHVIS